MQGHVLTDTTILEIRINFMAQNDWPEDALETLGHCPICGETKRDRLYDDLTDRLFNTPGRWTMYRCKSCQSGYLDPRPNELSIGLAYENYITHEPEQIKDIDNTNIIKRIIILIRNSYLNRKYGYKFEPSAPWGYFVMYMLPPPLRYEWDHYARHLPFPLVGKNRILDVGCGNGSFLIRVRQLGWQVNGLEFDMKAASLAKSQGIDVWVGDYRNAPFKANSFDAITCHQVIEHVHDVPAFIAHLSSWLKPDGRLWLGTPNINSFARKYFGVHWRGLHPPHHITILSPKTLLKLLNDYGLKGSLINRGFYETHIVSESDSLRHGIVGQDNITRHKKTMHHPLRNFLFELWSWLNPKQGSDLVIIAYKVK